LRRERLKTGNRTLHRLVRLSLCRPVSFHSTTKRAAAEGFSRNESVTIRALPTPARPGRVARRARARCLRNRSCGGQAGKRLRNRTNYRQGKPKKRREFSRLFRRSPRHCHNARCLCKMPYRTGKKGLVGVGCVYYTGVGYGRLYVRPYLPFFCGFTRIGSETDEVSA